MLTGFAVGCSNSVKKALQFHSSFLSPRITKRFIKFPPLTSIDLPDEWTPNAHRFLPAANNSNVKTATVLNGKSVANNIKSRIASEICSMKNSIGKIPGLGILLVGERMASQSFVRIKVKACDEVGIASFVEELPEDCKETDVLRVISSFNENPSVHGIIVQLPLPQHLNEEKIMNFVRVEKDVDGFHPLNMGNLAMQGREPLFVPCAPRGCIELLLQYGLELIGKKAVVIGRSKIVGLPISLLLQRYHATVSVVHAMTKNPEQVTSGADIVITDVGVPNIVRGSWLKQGAIVIDTGTNPLKDANSLHGRRVVGDVCYEEAITKASAITPVPGGVGPVTIAMLLSNALDSAKRAYYIA